MKRGIRFPASSRRRAYVSARKTICSQFLPRGISSGDGCLYWTLPSPLWTSFKSPSPRVCSSIFLWKKKIEENKIQIQTLTLNRDRIFFLVFQSSEKHWSCSLDPIPLIARNMKRMEFSDSGTADGGVELSLGLSIGGSSRRATNTGPVHHGTATRLGSGEGLPFEGGYPLRRREARKNGIFDGGNGVPAEDRAALEFQALVLRARDRKARERETFAADRRGRKSDGRIAGVARIPCPNPNNQNPVAHGSHPFPAMAMQYLYHQVQYLPVPIGLGFSFVMPCWAPVVSPVAADGSTHSEMNMLQQVARRISPVSATAVSADGGISGACYLDMKAGNGIGVNGAPSSINSPGYCLSGVPDQKSGSLPGSCVSNDTRSHSTHTMAENPGSQLSSQVSSSQRHAAPSSKGSDEGTEKIITSTAGSSLVLNSATSAMGKLDRATSVNKPISSEEDQNPNGSSSLPRMPYVSTTGNGPNGRTITGFLYTYTESEVSIICVCHGSSFSPEEFVRHAGGTNIAHPLRQIVVVP